MIHAVRKLTPFILLLPVVLAGCNWFTPLAFILPEHKRQVSAEFTQLSGSVAVMVWADSPITYDYPSLTLDVAAHVSDRLQAVVPEIKPIDVNDLEDFIKQKPRGRLPEDVGRHFQADYVIYLELLDFGLREASTPDIIQGRVYSSIVVYTFKDPQAPPQRNELVPISVKVPEGGPTHFSPGELHRVRKDLYETFAGQVAAKFYDHEEVEH